VELHPEFLEKNGEKQFVVLTYEEFLAIQEQLNDAEDLLEHCNAKRAEGKKNRSRSPTSNGSLAWAE
jgi:hypothetical protein